jgi:hypothetical protein
MLPSRLTSLIGFPSITKVFALREERTTARDSNPRCALVTYQPKQSAAKR